MYCSFNTFLTSKVPVEWQLVTAALAHRPAFFLFALPVFVLFNRFYLRTFRDFCSSSSSYVFIILFHFLIFSLFIVILNRPLAAETHTFLVCRTNNGSSDSEVTHTTGLD